LVHKEKNIKKGTKQVVIKGVRKLPGKSEERHDCGEQSSLRKKTWFGRFRRKKKRERRERTAKGRVQIVGWQCRRRGGREQDLKNESTAEGVWGGCGEGFYREKIAERKGVQKPIHYDLR